MLKLQSYLKLKVEGIEGYPLTLPAASLMMDCTNLLNKIENHSKNHNHFTVH